METDTSQGGEGLSIEQAAAAYTKATASDAIPKDDAEDVEQDDSGTTTDDELQASEEDVSEETDGETASEDDAEEQSDDDEPESEGGRFVADDAKVRLADGTVTTVHELKRGNLREADYTRKRQEDAALSAETAAEREALKASKKQVDEYGEYLRALVKSIIPPPPDPKWADENDPEFNPARYQSARVKRESWLQHLQYIEGQQQDARKEQEAKASKDATEKREKEWGALTDKWSALKDDKRLEKFVADLKEHGKSYGFSPEEIASVADDHRQALVMRDAIAWRKLQASKPAVEKKVEKRPPVTKGGKRLSPDAQRARSATDAMNRARETGSVDDVTRAWLAAHPSR